ncbi:SRPBCC family protein [Pseudonocardia xishanensis]|uniref:Activator of Hsp90 ATPase homologue 1/2-like C-terminal domain-containing protein n=1 Tax=Pseudonocardia xishanensis TaxID=630995 RepID=A0ABP8RLG6_9PSEU
MTDTLGTTGGRPSVRIERRYPHPIEKVWRAVTEPEHLSSWFPSPVELELRPGGPMRFAAFAEGEGGTGRVTTVEPPHRFEFRWGAEEIRIELSESGAETVVVLTHVFDDRPLGASLAAGWGACLAGLAAVVAGEPLPAPSREIDRHEELVRLLGLDQPVLTEADGQWTATFDRQLTCPADVAWRLFLGRAEAPATGAELRPAGAPGGVLGTVTAVEAERLLAFDVAAGEPGDRVRVELVAGSGHGARLVLTVQGADPAERTAAVERWGEGAVEHIARQAARWAHTEEGAGVSAL